MPGQIIARGKNTWLVRVFLPRQAHTEEAKTVPEKEA